MGDSVIRNFKLTHTKIKQIVFKYEFEKPLEYDKNTKIPSELTFGGGIAGNQETDISGGVLLGVKIWAPSTNTKENLFSVYIEKAGFYEFDNPINEEDLKKFAFKYAYHEIWLQLRQDLIEVLVKAGLEKFIPSLPKIFPFDKYYE